MKSIAALILNRNLPQLADELGDWILQQHASVLDLYVLENGSDPGNYSRYANIILRESRGPAGGVNEGLRQLLGRGYKYIWVSYNDARYQPTGFLDNAIKLLEQDSAVALVFPYWPDNISVYGKRNGRDLVIFSAILGFVVRCSTVQTLAQDSPYRLEPLWDSSNFSNHDNIIATLVTLYEKQLCAITDRRFTVTELTAPADQTSATARGFSNEEWKNSKGLADVEAWYARTFPELTGTYKEKRAQLMKKNEHLIISHRLGSVSRLGHKLKNFKRRAYNLSRQWVRAL